MRFSTVIGQFAYWLRFTALRFCMWALSQIDTSRHQREAWEWSSGRSFDTIAKRYATCPRNVDIELCSYVRESLGR